MLMRLLLWVSWSHVSVIAAIWIDLDDTVALSSSILLTIEQELERRIDGRSARVDGQSPPRWSSVVGLFDTILPLQMTMDSPSDLLVFSSLNKALWASCSFRVRSCFKTAFFLGSTSGRFLSLWAFRSNTDFDATEFVLTINGRHLPEVVDPILKSFSGCTSTSSTSQVELKEVLSSSFSSRLKIMTLSFLSSRSLISFNASLKLRELIFGEDLGGK